MGIRRKGDETGQHIDRGEQQGKDTDRGKPGCNPSKPGDEMVKAWKNGQALLNACLDKETRITVSGDEEEVERE